MFEEEEDKEEDKEDQFLHSLNMKPSTSLLGVLCSLGYHIERILKNWSLKKSAGK